jgi:hypothetical protein
MKITVAELQAQTDGLIKTVGLNTPEQIGVIVIMVDKESGLLCQRAMKIDKGRTVEALKNILKGYGDQIITEGVDRV